MKLSEEEANCVNSEIVERIKDMVYMNLEYTVRKNVTKMLIEEHDSTDAFDINWTVHMCAGDIHQIVGRNRREKIDDQR